MKIERQSKKDMKKNIFSIKFYYRPEISYEDWILKVYVDDRNICEFTVDGRIEEDTGNLIFLSDWFKNNLKFILNKNDEFPLAVDGNSGIEIRKKAYAIGIKENKEIEWFEAVHEWSERHLWTFSGLEMIYPDVMFRRIENKIEISWDSRNKYTDNKNYKIEFTYPKGSFFVNTEKFEKEVLSFIDRIEKVVKIISEKMKSVFNGKYIDSSYLYKRVSKDSLQRNFLEEINKSGYNFNSIYDLMLLNEKDKNIVSIFLKYLKLFELDIKMHLVRFLGVKGFVGASKFLLEEFHKTEDFDYRFAIANTLSLIQDENILEDLIEIVENRMYGEARIPIIYRLHKFKNFQLEKVLIKLLNDKEVSKIAEYSLNKLKNI
ncbi:DUF5984 family protein [Leptotrichia sp. oral taxon 212]|uniref:DUF5984 family protein n=1 Tax=Leptotrichia sp. oral taxon 212 TaxID=712357 RepID=UPI0006A9A93A|nr:DUF5984 family protein [Leptotrichia sp. oral taxon 212]ALA94762.1 hypothetical protein AMK43_00685 [Leptotrichia sp. oral taxon 212]